MKRPRFEFPQFEIGRGEVANSNLGNGNLRPETFGKTRRERGMETAEKTQQTEGCRCKARYSVVEEITSICADCLVELRGFEPLTSAVRGTRGPDGAAASVVEGLSAESARWIQPRPALLHSPYARPALRRSHRSR